MSTTKDNMNASAIPTSDAGETSIYRYSFDMECPVPWPSETDSINQDYPFQGTERESYDEFVMRRYLETLWLPESITPLDCFVSALRRITVLSESPEALHAALKPLLLSVDATEEKYRQELPLILQNDGGAGEIEEAMMWYSWSREKRPNKNGDSNDSNGNADEEEWKKAWMQRLERREVQVQILLYLHLLSVPCPTQNRPPGSPSKKRRREVQESLSPDPGAAIGTPPKKRRKQLHDLVQRQVSPPTPSIEAATASTPDSISQSLAWDQDLRMEDRVEGYMDKLCIWQLLASTSKPDSSHTTAEDQRDWMQVFCEDVVEPLFREQLPEICDLLRTKVFPHSPFSEDSDHPLSPALPAKRVKTKGKRPPSPLSLQELERPQPGTRTRSRSASISVEEVRARGASRGGVATSKALWKGEVEMKRASSRRKITKVTPRTGVLAGQHSQSVVLPSEARLNASRPRSSKAKPKTLVVDTPVKKMKPPQID